MRRLLLFLLPLMVALVLTGGLSWLAVRNYRAAAPLAEETLRGLALTVAGGMEELVLRGVPLDTLNSLMSPEVAYSALISAEGKFLFHTNGALIGSPIPDARFRPVLASETFHESRIRLGTGEVVYEFQSHFHRGNEIGVLRLALHTWRAETVMRQARQGMTVIFSLLGVSWLLGLGVFWLLQRQVEQQRLSERQHELARLGEVGAVLAHEVRNPLAGIKGYGQLLEERLAPGKERDFAGLIVSEARHLEGLVEDILLYTRPMQNPLVATNLAALVQDVQALLAPQFVSTGVRVDCHVPPELQAVCPAEGLRRVLVNLLNNGVQASPPGGVVTLVARRIGKQVEFTVADQGEGIAVAMRPGLFKPFQTSKARGSGLGLAICKKIIDGCGGSISAEAAPGGGALFRVLLPCALCEGENSAERQNSDR